MTQVEVYNKIKKYKWKKFLTRPYTPFFVSMHVRSYHLEIRKVLPRHFKNYLYVSRSGQTVIYRDEDELQSVLGVLKFYVAHSPKKVSFLLNEAKKAERIIITQSVSKNKTIDAYSYFRKAFRLFGWAFIRMTFIPYFLGISIEKYCDYKKPYYKKVLKDLMHYREMDIYSRYEKHNIHPFLRKFAKRNKITFQQAQNLNFKEISQWQEHNIKVSRKELSSRNKRYVYTFFPSQESVISSSRFISKIDKLFAQPDIYYGDTIKGITAQPGKATGRVAIISSINSLKKVIKGRIMISPSTSPNMLSAMKRAGAIVTDEGGITSHASVNSRELKKPCVIGTKIATKVLKDGDKVEVDATKGIVRKI